MPIRVVSSAPSAPAPRTRLRGLGDAVAVVAKPVKAVLGKVGVRLDDCGCNGRQEWLNDKVPF